ncbi:beta-galactosidase [Niabella yanshanensis]|uniref:Beta-galactosidase n=1 Tax=Niabella yanshanensis TaxID=577386 RepID=A0ABZ0W668_9BACT|nr:beta-galactosidase [Niabella yanshanensis]WQD38007.1 beta-galactosidase [Niabella yanshanensis]
MKNKLLLLCLMAVSSIGLAQAIKQFEINADLPQQKIFANHLKLGGTNPNGERIAVNNYYISINDTPIIPVTGEFHYSRYPHQYWDESIKKMKAGGITVIPTYVFWNLHEEEEGKFVWSGDKDLRGFIELCKKSNIYSIVRVGPFCHGEIRNGGLPDWLLGKPLNIRTNDSLYLSYVKKLYDEIGKQLKGLYYKDGGPVIGIQLENEYQHSAAPWGLTYPGQPLDFTASERDRGVTHEGVAVSTANNPYAALGNDHMKVLKSLAEKAGMVTPLYTATGWGNAAIVPNESIPVTAAYAYPFWTPKRDYSPFFLYKNMHANPDYAPVRYTPENYPALPAELGSGISLTYLRRPVVVHQSFDAMINRCLGSGANGIGYYMYHSGSTPRGKHNFMNDEAYGVNKISYEYQGPIGEYGQVREGFHRLKLTHFFLRDFGDLLAPMTVALPANAASLKPENIHDLRYAIRFKGSSGFLFLNNFQDDTAMIDQEHIQVKIKTAAGDVLIPASGGFNLASGENAIFPFNFDCNGTKLIYATAQLLMKGEDEMPYFVFFTPNGVKGAFSFEPGTIVESIKGAKVNRTSVTCTADICEFAVIKDGKKTRVLVVDKERALKAYTIAVNGKKSLLFSNAIVLQNENNFELLSDSANNFHIDIYPKTTAVLKAPAGNLKVIKENPTFSSWHITLPAFEPKLSFREISSRKTAVALPQALPAGINDIYLQVNYKGDTGMDFVNGELVADNFYNGLPWQVGLRKFLSAPVTPKEMVFYFRPMQKDATYLQDLEPYPGYVPDFGKANEYLKVDSISLIPQYKITINF